MEHLGAFCLCVERCWVQMFQAHSMDSLSSLHLSRRRHLFEDRVFLTFGDVLSVHSPVAGT